MLGPRSQLQNKKSSVSQPTSATSLLLNSHQSNIFECLLASEESGMPPTSPEDRSPNGVTQATDLPAMSSHPIVIAKASQGQHLMTEDGKPQLNT